MWVGSADSCQRRIQIVGEGVNIPQWAADLIIAMLCFLYAPSILAVVYSVFADTSTFLGN
jgi:hypothetical protein